MGRHAWPDADRRKHLGKRIKRLDGPVKATGVAKYAHDKNPEGLLHAKAVVSPHAHATVTAIDLGPALAMPGVKGAWKDESLVGGEVDYVGEIVAAVAAETEEQAAEAAAHVKVSYEVLEHLVDDTDPEEATGRPSRFQSGDVDEGLAAADTVVEGEYGCPVITHCCLEPHGQVTELRDDGLYIWPSTQNVSRYADGLDQVLDIPMSDIHVECQYMGGGFGAKFSFDKWGRIGAKLTQDTGRPVKFMLDRREELMIAGNRPSTRGKVKIGVKNDGTITAFDSEMWGSGGMGGFRPPNVPYVFGNIPNTRRRGLGIRTNRGSQRAWRAPGHPQGCLMTMAAFEDAAAALGMDALEFYKKNLQFTDRPELYAEQLDIAADLIGYRDKAHLRSALDGGTVKRGLGIGLHMWGGVGHPSECEVIINGDGSVETRMGTQDLGTGTRTVLAIVTAETLGLELEQVTVRLGRNAYPVSGGSGGSTTVGGVSASTRLASVDALEKLFEAVAPELDVEPSQLEAWDGRIRQIDKPENGMAWADACALLGPNAITGRGTSQPGTSQEMGLISGGVGGVQIADVSVDVETGVVVLHEMVAVQDCGLIVDMKTAESQVYGGLIMGITFGLYEECVYDNATGWMLNADMEFYRLAGLQDVGKLKIHMMTGEGHDDRGVIGLGEPPVIAPGAALSNAVANAIGIRVPEIPLTPDRVLAALNPEGGRG